MEAQYYNAARCAQLRRYEGYNARPGRDMADGGLIKLREAGPGLERAMFLTERDVSVVIKRWEW